RCLNEYGLNPDSGADPVVVSRQDLLARKEQNLELVSFADVEMANLYQQLAGSGYSIILTDRDGVLLSYYGDPSFKRAASRTGLVPGAAWSERHGGTNGMGTCLLERARPRQCTARARIQHLAAYFDPAQPQAIVSPAADLRGASRQSLLRRRVWPRVWAAGPRRDARCVARRAFDPDREPQRSRRTGLRRPVDGAQYRSGETGPTTRHPDSAARRNGNRQGAFRARLAR